MRRGPSTLLLPSTLVCQAASSRPSRPTMPQQVTPAAHAFLGARRRLGPLARSSQPPLLTSSGQSYVALPLSPARGSRWTPLGLPVSHGQARRAAFCLFLPQGWAAREPRSQPHSSSILMCPPTRLASPADFITTISATCTPGVRHAGPLPAGGAPGLGSPVPSVQKPMPAAHASQPCPPGASQPGGWSGLPPSSCPFFILTILKGTLQGLGDWLCDTEALGVG